MDSSDDGKDLSEVRQPRPATRPKTRLRIKTAGAEYELFFLCDIRIIYLNTEDRGESQRTKRKIH